MFSPNFNRTFCKQTLKIQIRPRSMLCLVWVSTVCLCFIKRTLGLNGLTISLPMEFSIKLDTVKSGWSIVYIEGVTCVKVRYC